MSWIFPINGWLTPGVPVGEHPGAFGVTRKNHIHEGVDLYCEPGTPVRAVEKGLVVWVGPFTGPGAGSPWWHDTQAVMVEGASGLVVYGEIDPAVTAGCQVGAGALIGRVKRVLRRDKGLPTSMLHIELRGRGKTESFEWSLGTPRPEWLFDPTPFLLSAK